MTTVCAVPAQIVVRTAGIQGAPGSVWRNGTGVPSNSLGIDGDYYLNDADGNVYHKVSGAYVLIANVEGPAGPPGPFAPVLMGTFTLSSAVAQTITLVASARYPVTIQGLYNLVCEAGTIDVTVAINGVPVTGLDSVAVTGVRQDPVATAANAVSVNDVVTVVLAGPSLASNLQFTMQLSTT